MKDAIFAKLRTLFVVSLCICMLLGGALTAIQLAGIVFNQPTLVIESQQLLLKPVVAFAAAFSVLSFAASYFQTGTERTGEEEDEI